MRGEPAAGPRSSDGTIQPYSSSTSAGSAPSRTIRSARRSAAWIATCTLATNRHSGYTKWSEGRKTTVASGSRCIAWTSPSSTPGAVSRLAGCSMNAPSVARAVRARSTSRWWRPTTVRMRPGWHRLAARSIVWSSIDRVPVNAQYCLGTWRPSQRSVSGRRRMPSPPASTTVIGCVIDVIICFPVLPPASAGLVPRKRNRGCNKLVAGWRDRPREM